MENPSISHKFIWPKWGQNTFLLQEKCIIEINGNTLQNTDIELFNNLHLIIDNYDKGNYEFGNIKITIENKNSLNNIIVTNPPFDMDLLKIE